MGKPGFAWTPFYVLDDCHINATNPDAMGTSLARLAAAASCTPRPRRARCAAVLTNPPAALRTGAQDQRAAFGIVGAQVCGLMEEDAGRPSGKQLGGKTIHVTRPASAWHTEAIIRAPRTTEAPAGTDQETAQREFEEATQIFILHAKSSSGDHVRRWNRGREGPRLNLEHSGCAPSVPDQTASVWTKPI